MISAVPSVQFEDRRLKNIDSFKHKRCTKLKLHFIFIQCDIDNWDVSGVAGLQFDMGEPPPDNIVL